MNDRLRRVVALLLIGGGVLVVVGLVVMHREWPGWSYRADGLNGSYTVDESSYQETGSTIGVVAGGVVASTGMLMAVVGAVAIGVRLAAPDRGVGPR